MFGPYRLLRNIGSPYFTQSANDLRVCHDLEQRSFGQVQYHGSESELFLSSLYRMEKHWKFLLHIKIAYDLRVCHNLVPRSFVEVQGHYQKMHNSCLDHMLQSKMLKKT